MQDISRFLITAKTETSRENWQQWFAKRTDRNFYSISSCGLRNIQQKQSQENRKKQWVP